MAIKITDTIQTDKGATTALYILIDSVAYQKDIAEIHVSVKTYKDAEARAYDSECKTFDIKRTYIFEYDVTELTDNAYTIAYDKITNKLNTLYNTEAI